ncbi:nucleotide sugar dehydrogenase [Listeria fleischmannii subsp. coloradonensis]|nr:nucleotide sugar dehydrogenase [Listeria fleischmannii subsp. coloradonensis]
MNMNMPYRVVDKIQDALNSQGKSIKGSKVLLVGAAYKSDINDVRESPMLDIYEILKLREAEITVMDPFVTDFRNQDGEIVRVIQKEICNFNQYDCAVVLTKHSKVNYTELLAESSIVIDTRHIYKDIDSEKIYKIGGKR